ncbi:MAG: response regulator [Desulfarculaceae bacterium]|nr:response regulator [Desulfarculaceae bacterium]MCF8073782.1 response regulator [Desulfarculaceae bacterium]MCF8102023.1 response regulator [Desulfarculaceae bacterium]MCF8115993.1 response regulator [Desulfarculaceae bacterium]
MHANYIVLGSAAPLMLATAALLFCLFQLWMYFWRLGQNWNLWEAAISLGIGIYAAAVVFDYNLGAVPAGMVAEKIEYSCLVALIPCLFGFTFSYFSLPYKRYHYFALPLHAVLIAVIWLTPWVISDQFVTHDFLLLSVPYVEPRPGPLGPWLLLYLLAASLGIYVLWFQQRRKHRREYRYFMAAFALWLVLAAHDFLITMAWIPPTIYLMEFGFLGFLSAGMGFTLLRYRRMAQSMRQSQKMEAIGTLAGGVAHDFNNILQVLLGQSELMKQHPRLPPDLRPGLDNMISSLERARDLVQRLLTVGRKLTARVVPVDLNHEVRLVVGILESTLPRMIAIGLELAPNLRPIKGDPGQLEQLLLNLASNARDAMPGGGRLTLGTANLRLGAARSPGGPPLPPGHYVVLSVADTGQGMDATALQRCYDPFFTTKEVGKGTGLGLSTVYGIVEAHQGLIVCDSAPGEGTRFTIYLPADSAQAAKPAPAPALATPAPKARGGVLVVDDEKGIRESVVEYLSHLGHQVFEADSGEQALEVYAAHQQEVDAVVLDLSMPGMGGKACLERLTKFDPQAKVLVASGYAGSEVSRELDGMGAAGFITKPFRLSELGKALEALG